jgi:hypothetical protein
MLAGRKARVAWVVSALPVVSAGLRESGHPVPGEPSPWTVPQVPQVPQGRADRVAAVA